MNPLHSIPMPRIDPEDLNNELSRTYTSSLTASTSLIQMHHGVSLARLIVIIVRRYRWLCKHQCDNVTSL